MEDDKIRIAGVVKESIVDGPGIRYVIFTQGCPHHCPGCHNPQTHDECGGKFVSQEELIKDIHSNPLVSGVTFSGGEPFLQAKVLSELASKLKKEKYDIMVYTGYEYEYLKKNANDNNCYMDLLKKSDILVDGKFDIAKKDERLVFKGSSNQRVIDLKTSLSENNLVIKECM